jgi:hypothetical protein
MKKELIKKNLKNILSNKSDKYIKNNKNLAINIDNIYYDNIYLFNKYFTSGSKE